jgi:hypothetical protein
LEQIKATALAVAQMAEQQIAIQNEVKRAHSRLDLAGVYVKGLERRLSDVEDKVNPPNDYITNEQAAQLSLSVKALAEFLTSKGPNKNHYQGIFTEIYRRFGVREYRQVRLSQFMEVIRFLDDWREAAAKAEVSVEDTSDSTGSSSSSTTEPSLTSAIAGSNEDTDKEANHAG